MPQVQVIQPIQQQPKRLRVAGYARVSSKSADQLNSMSVQVEYYTDLIQKNPNWEFVGVYADEGITGTSTKHREQFNRLMDDCRAGLIDRVMVKSASRFARNTVDALSAVRELMSLNVVVVFEKESFDTSTATGEMLLSMLCAAAQHESLSISHNLKWGLRKRMKSGTFRTASVPFGYKQIEHQLIPIPEEAAIVRKIYELYLAGWGTEQISQHLIHKQIFPNMRWSHVQIQRMLKNEKYLGDTLLQKSYSTNTIPFKQIPNRGQLPQYYIKNTHPGIITVTQFQATQKLLSQKGVSAHNSPSSPLSKVMHCAICGAVLSKKVNRSGITTWVCRTHRQDAAKCPVQPISEMVLYRAFLYMHNKLLVHRESLLDSMLNDLLVAQRLLDTAESSRNSLQEDHDRFARQLHNLERLHAQGIIDGAKYFERRSQIERQLAELKLEFARVIPSRCLCQSIASTKHLISIIQQSAPLDAFDWPMFRHIVKNVIVDQHSIKFVLINGLVLEEDY